MKFFHHRTSIIQRKFEVALFLMVFVAFLFMCYVGLFRHWSLGSYHFDLGNMHQAVHNTAHGRFLEVTDPNLFFQSNRLGYHFDPILAAFAPFYMLYDGAEVLIVGQALVLVLGAVPLYLLATRVLGHKFYGLAFAASYLLYYPMQATAIADFHAVTLSTTFLLWMFYFAEVRRFGWSIVFMLLAWLTKENVPLVTAFFGLYHVVFRRNVRFGAGIFAASCVAFTVITFVLIPSLRPEEGHLASHYYTTDVQENMQRFFRPETARYISSLLAPTGFMSLLAPQYLLISLPEWMINLLSRNGNMRVLRYHYTAQLTPFIFIATIYGAQQFARLFHAKKDALPLAVTAIVCASLFFSLFNSPLYFSDYRTNHKQLQVVRDWQEKLKDDSIPVSATGHLSPYFSGRSHFYNFFFDFAYEVQGQTSEEIRELADHYTAAEYVLVKESEAKGHPMVTFYYDHLKNNPQYDRIFDEEGIEVYKRN